MDRHNASLRASEGDLFDPGLIATRARDQPSPVPTGRLESLEQLAGRGEGSCEWVRRGAQCVTVCGRECVYVYVCVCVCMSVCACMYIYVHVCVHVMCVLSIEIS